MEIKLNVPDWLKIPLNILLPTLWVISGMLLLFPDKWLVKFYLLNWRNEQGFAIGLAFLVSSGLLLVYLCFFLKKLLSTLIYKCTYKRKAISRISKLSDMEQVILIKLYNSPGYTCELDYNQPLIQSLLSRKYIYMGGQQAVSLNVFTNSIPAKFTLQSHVHRAFDFYVEKLQKYISKLEKRINKTNNSNKKERLQAKIVDAKETLAYICGGLEND